MLITIKNNITIQTKNIDPTIVEKLKEMFVFKNPEFGKAKAMAKAAGRPYPNLVDNMRAAK